MHSYGIVEILSYLEPLSCLAVLLIMQWRNLIRSFKPLAAFLVTRVVSFAMLMPLDVLAHRHILTRATAYHIYFYGYWASYALEAMLGFFVIYSIYSLSMEPLQGLQRLGNLMFRWAAGIAVALAVTIALGPHVTSAKFIVQAVGQLQQTQSILTLCLLLFVCLAIRPMGLSYRSRIFGISLGLGISAATDLVYSSWFFHFDKNMYSSMSVVKSIAICLTIAVWGAYFAIPEPKRRMIVLPTTSPFLRWNQISMALGDAPGFVALGPITPDMFAPAELEVMRRASAKMRLPIAN
jgi:hypothetical protein